MTTRSEILEISRQNQIGELDPWFITKLDELIDDGYFPLQSEIVDIGKSIVVDLKNYREETNLKTVVIGMSGGVDSALTAALFKAAGWEVLGHVLPIHQDPAETQRGIETCEALGIQCMKTIDLSKLYDFALFSINDDDLGATNVQVSSVKIRRGNIRARLRMITLYNAAAAHGGIVASTDNLSELAAGFWTLHGDVGDLSPIQSLLKSWEVPMLARIYGVPESTITAMPTDGLGISNGDEEQLGCSYLEWDIMLHALVDSSDSDLEAFKRGRPAEVFKAVTSRMAGSWFKRVNPINIPHPLWSRFSLIAKLDDSFQPDCVKRMLDSE